MILGQKKVSFRTTHKLPPCECPPLLTFPEKERTKRERENMHYTRCLQNSCNITTQLPAQVNTVEYFGLNFAENTCVRCRLANKLANYKKTEGTPG